jgi:tetratricopeptide (TPR) repeat protein
LSYCGIWRKPGVKRESASLLRTGLDQGDIPLVEPQQRGHLIDLTVNSAPPAPGPKERAATALTAAEAALKARPNDPDARFARASALFRLGENQKALEDLNAVIGEAPQLTGTYGYRARIHARLGRKDEARADLETFRKVLNSSGSGGLDLEIIVAAELGEGTDQALDKLEAALRTQPGDPSLDMEAACACAIASEALARADRAKSHALAERALALVKKSILDGYPDDSRMREDPNLAPIRDLPGYAEMLKEEELDRSYAAVWSDDYRFRSISVAGFDPVTHLQRCHKLASEGYRIVAVSVVRPSPGDSPITASVWHRPVIAAEPQDRLAERWVREAGTTQGLKDSLAERQARAAITLLH